MGNTIPQGVSPAVTKTVPELEIVPRYNRFLQLLEDRIVAATFEAFAVVGEMWTEPSSSMLISASASATMLVDAFGEQRDLNVCAARVGKKSFASDGLASPGERIWETAR